MRNAPPSKKIIFSYENWATESLENRFDTEKYYIPVTYKNEVNEFSFCYEYYHSDEYEN